MRCFNLRHACSLTHDATPVTAALACDENRRIGSYRALIVEINRATSKTLKVLHLGHFDRDFSPSRG